MQQKVARAAGRRVDLFDLNVVCACFFALHGCKDLRFSGFSLAFSGNGQRLRAKLLCVLGGKLSKNAALGIGKKRTAVTRQVKIALEFSRRGALASFHRLDRCVHEHGSHDDHDHDHEEDEHDSDEIEYDEHIWTSPKNAVVLCRAVCDAICRADAENAAFYRANCENYCAQLEDLDARFAALCESAPRRLLIFADRFPMLYFCREYGLDYRAAFHGCSGDTEPSLATIKFLIDKVEDENIPVVYTIDFGTKKVAAVVSECTGAAIDTLYSMQTVSRADFDAGETYLTLMERNFEALRKGLNA